MSFEIKKNTISSKLKATALKLQNRGQLAVARGLEVIRTEVVPLTPVITSRLKNSIEGRPQAPKDTILSVTQEGRVVVGVMGTNVPYARRVEFGFVGKDSAGRNYNQQGRFYFTRGYNAAKPKIDRVMANTLNVEKL